MTTQGYTKYVTLLFCSLLLISGGYAVTNPDEELPPPVQEDSPDPNKAILVTEDTFVCLKKMHPVRGFFVGNLLDRLDDTVAAAMRGFFVGNLLDRLDDTVAAAMQPEGAPYPPGSIVQLIPAEAMIKHHKGWSAKTNDWEFFELDISEEGSKIKVRGTTRVKNKFGGNCFECHQKAKPQWDFICEKGHGCDHFICEKGHGCDPLPIPGFFIRSIQRNDPRCNDEFVKPPEPEIYRKL